MVRLDRMGETTPVRRQLYLYVIANDFRSDWRVSEQLGNAADAVGHEPSPCRPKMGLHPFQPASLGQAVEDRCAIGEKPGLPRRTDPGSWRAQAPPQRSLPITLRVQFEHGLARDELDLGTGFMHQSGDIDGRR